VTVVGRHSAEEPAAREEVAPVVADVPAAREEVEPVVADDPAAFESFVTEVEPRLRRALVAAYGSDRGREATAEALAYAWEHWDRLRHAPNRAGYLFRVAQSKNRRRRVPVVFATTDDVEHLIEPGLRAALAALTTRQRLAVVLVHGFGWTLQEVGELTGTKGTTVQNHVSRGLRHLRTALGVHLD
jgi:DNA-directed RNA polymerase specialized sigma24 family protein